MSNCHHASSVVRPCELCQALGRIADLEKGLDYEQQLRIGLRRDLDDARRQAALYHADMMRVREQRDLALFREAESNKAFWSVSAERDQLRDRVRVIESAGQALIDHEALMCVVDPPCGNCAACSARIAFALETTRT